MSKTFICRFPKLEKRALTWFSFGSLPMLAVPTWQATQSIWCIVDAKIVKHTIIQLESPNHNARFLLTPYVRLGHTVRESYLLQLLLLPVPQLAAVSSVDDVETVPAYYYSVIQRCQLIAKSSLCGRRIRPVLLLLTAHRQCAISVTIVCSVLRIVSRHISSRLIIVMLAILVIVQLMIVSVAETQYTGRPE